MVGAVVFFISILKSPYIVVYEMPCLGYVCLTVSGPPLILDSMVTMKSAIARAQPFHGEIMRNHETPCMKAMAANDLGMLEGPCLLSRTTPAIVASSTRSPGCLKRQLVPE